MKIWQTAMGAAVVLAALTTAPAAAVRTVAVGINDFKYGPAVLRISHEETFTQAFTRRGTYVYFCALHRR